MNLLKVGAAFINSARVVFLFLLAMILLPKLCLRRDELYVLAVVIFSIFVGGGENFIAMNGLFCLFFCFFAKQFDIECVFLSGFWVLPSLLAVLLC